MNNKITIIGNGSMAFALAKGLYNSFDLEIIGRNNEKVKNFKNRVLAESENKNFNIETGDLEHFDISGKVILLTVKPYALKAVAEKVIGKSEILYSVLAGSSIESLKAISSENYIRMMPNVSAFHQSSFSLLVGEPNKVISDEVRQLTDKVFSAVGETIWLDSENDLDIGTGISGSGPAYLSLVAEAMSDGAVKSGLKRDVADKIVKGLFRSFSALMTDENRFADIKDSVMSPKGTTASGYTTLEENNVRNAFIKSIENAYKQSQVLKKS